MSASEILAKQSALIDAAKGDQYPALLLRQMAERIIYEMFDVPGSNRFIADITDMALRSERLQKPVTGA